MANSDAKSIGSTGLFHCLFTLKVVLSPLAHRHAEEKFWLGVRDFSAGVFGGICGVIAGQPLDFIRVRSEAFEFPPYFFRSSSADTAANSIKRC